METIVLLHGWGVRPENYQTLIDSLNKKYQVIAPPIYNLTEKELTWKKLSKNLDKFIGKKNVYLLGTSLGGGLALAYAALFPQKAKGVIVCEPVGAKIKKTKLIGAFLLSKMSGRALFYPGAVSITASVVKAFFKELFFNFMSLYRLVNLVLNQDIEDLLPKIKAPVYILWSKNPDVLPLKMGERLHQRIPDSTLNPNFSDKNHLWCLIEQEKVAEETKKILETSPLGEREERKTENRKPQRRNIL